MKCREFKKILEEYTEGKALNENALEHMRECPACAREFSVINKMKAAFREKEKVNIPLDFNDAVWLRLKEQPPVTWQRAVKSILQRPLVPQAAAAVLAVILILVFGVRFSTNTQGQKVAQANKPQTLAAQKKMPVLQAAAQPKKQEAAAKEKQMVAENKQAQAKKQEAEGNKTTQAKEAAVTQNEGGQAVPHISLALAGKQVNTGAAQQRSGAAVESGNSVSAAEVQKTPTEEEMKEDLQIKNNVINPEKGESVTVQYKVAQPSEILIKVYDRRGEPIKTIESGFRETGIYEDSWNGYDDTGAQVSAGIYVIYIKTGLVETKRKVCIVK